MARPILSEYGPDTAKSEVPSMTKNGPADCRPIPYSPPVGPKGIGHVGPGLGDENLGCAGTQGKQ